MKNIVRFVLLFALAMTTAACSIQAELFAGSLHNEIDPDDDTGGVQKTPYADGVYGVQLDSSNGYETFIVRKNMQGIFERIEKTDALSISGVQAVGRTLLSTAIDLQTSRYSIYRLSGTEQTELISDIADASLKVNFVHNNKYYVQKNDNSLVSIDAMGTVATVCSHCAISRHRRINGTFAFFEPQTPFSNTFFMGPLSNIASVSTPTNWVGANSGVSTLIGNTAYASGKNSVTFDFGIMKFENGTSTAILTPGVVSSMGQVGSSLYVTTTDSGRNVLLKLESNGSLTQVADLGNNTSNGKIIGQNSTGFFIVKEDTNLFFEVFFYNGTFTKITSFQDNTSGNTIYDAVVIGENILFSYNSQYYLANQATSTALTNIGNCLRPSFQIYLINNIIHTSNDMFATCRLNGFAFETILSDSMGPVTEIK